MIQLLDLDEVRQLWGFSVEKIYGAATRGEIRAYGRPDRQKYYSAAELVRVFGAPPERPDHPPEVAKLRVLVGRLALYNSPGSQHSPSPAERVVAALGRLFGRRSAAAAA